MHYDGFLCGCVLHLVTTHLITHWGVSARFQPANHGGLNLCIGWPKYTFRAVLWQRAHKASLSGMNMFLSLLSILNNFAFCSIYGVRHSPSPSLHFYILPFLSSFHDRLNFILGHSAFIHILFPLGPFGFLSKQSICFKKTKNRMMYHYIVYSSLFHPKSYFFCLQFIAIQHIGLNLGFV